MFRRIWSLIKKELQTQLRDPKSRQLLIAPVVIQVALFPFAATLEVKNNTIGIYNQDGGSASVELTQRLSHTKAFTKILMLHSKQAVSTTIDNQKALLVVTIPSDFSRKIATGNTGKLQVIADGRRSNAAQIATGYVQEIVRTYSNELMIEKYNMKPPSSIVVRNWFNPNLDYKWFILPCLIAMITTIGCLIVTSLSVAREREQGTFDQLLVSPLTAGFIMIGKTVPALLIALIQASIILFAAIFVYHIPFQGSILLLYACLLCYGLSLAGIGLLISSICSTQQQAFLGVFGFVMPSILLSGFVSPIENIPQPLQALTWINPIRHFIVISKGIYLKSFDLAFVWKDLWPLFVIAAMTLSFAYIMFTRHSK